MRMLKHIFSRVHQSPFGSPLDNGPGGALDPERAKRILSPWTLRFVRKDLERFYMEHHWRNMSYWLLRSVIVVLIYATLVLIIGDEYLMKSFDVRMDQNFRKTPLQEYATLDDLHANASDSGSKSMITVSVGRHAVTIPHHGFVLWHYAWSLIFLVVLLLDRFQSRCCRGSQRWITARSYVLFGMMFFDLLITAVLNPTVTRFMMFVYALLIRVQFFQTVLLVILSSVALLGAGYVGSHSEFLNSVSVTEFLLLNFICALASRQIEMHARLSLYRLWYIMAKKSLRHGPGAVDSSVTGEVSEQILAQNLLSLDEIGLDVIPEIDEDGDIDVDLCLTPEGNSPRSELSHRSSQKSESSYNMSVASCISVGSGERRLNCSKLGTPGPTASGSRPSSPRGQKSPRSQAKSDGSRSAEHSESGSETSHPSPCKNAGAVADNASLMVLPDGSSGGLALLARNDRVLQSRSAVSCYAEPPMICSQLRGKSYFTDGANAPGSAAAFSIHSVLLLRTNEGIYHIADKLLSVKRLVDSHLDQNFFIVNRIVPFGNGKVINTVTVFIRRNCEPEDPAFDGLLRTFVSRIPADNCNSQEFRNARFKYFMTLERAPTVLQRTFRWLHANRPVILGRGYLDQHHFTGPNYVEVDVDVSSSKVAQIICGLVLGQASKLVLDEMFLLEGQCEDELPERPLGCIRWNRVDVEGSVVDLEQGPDGAYAAP